MAVAVANASHADSSSLAGSHQGQTRRAGLVDDLEVCTAASPMRIAGRVTVACIGERTGCVGGRESEIITLGVSRFTIDGFSAGTVLAAD